MKDWGEDDLSPQTLDYCLQSSEIPFDSFQIAIFINDAPMEEQQMVIVGCVDKIQQSFHDISDSSPCQATYPSKSDQQMGFRTKSDLVWDGFSYLEWPVSSLHLLQTFGFLFYVSQSPVASPLQWVSRLLKFYILREYSLAHLYECYTACLLPPVTP